MINMSKLSHMINRKIKTRTKQFLGKYSNTVREIYKLNDIDILMDRISAIQDIYIPASINHRAVFEKYRGIHIGQSIVIIGTGPTAEFYEPIEGAIHIAINHSIEYESIQYDYFFASDYNESIDEMYIYARDYRKEVKKFYAINSIFHGDYIIPSKYRRQSDVENFYNDELSGIDFKKANKFYFPIDLCVSPLKTFGTTMHAALEFALWTEPSSIYLVGADCNSGQAFNNPTHTEGDIFERNYMVEGWRIMSKSIKQFYSNTTIYSINPVGLKGVFNDVYTDRYVKTKLGK